MHVSVCLIVTQFGSHALMVVTLHYLIYYRCHICSWNSLVFKVKLSCFTDIEEDVDDEHPVFPPKRSKRTTYECPNEECMRTFTTQKAVEAHVEIGDCEMHTENSLTDRAKIMYAEKVNTLELNSVEIVIPCSKSQGHSVEPAGWAIRSKRKRTAYNEKQVKYMTEKFNIGKATGRKCDPFTVAEEMRYMKKADGFVFSRCEYLTGQQISAYFSRLALKDRKMEQEDFRAAEEEDSKKILREKIMSKMADVTEEEEE